MSGSEQKCRFCSVPLYIKVEQYTQPVLMPLTEAGAIWDKWVSTSGKNYAQLINRYCPMCGRKVKKGDL